MSVECQVLAQLFLLGGDYFRRFVVAFLCLLVAILPFVAALTLTVLVPTLRVCAFRFTKPFKKPIFFSTRIFIRTQVWHNNFLETTLKKILTCNVA